MTIHDTLVRPLVTEKGIMAKDENRTLCFQVAKDANKIMVKQAVEKLFKVKVEEVRTATFDGKLRRLDLTRSGAIRRVARIITCGRWLRR